MEGYTGAKTPEASDVAEEETYHIMTMNMNGKSQRKESTVEESAVKESAVKENAGERRKLIVSIIDNSSASVIFCQELPGKFEKEVVPNSYKFVRPWDCYSGEAKVAVMWRETDFQGKEVNLADSSLFTGIVKSLLIEEKKLDVGVIMASIRSAMVKLTSRKNSEASFLAVSWHGPQKVKTELPIETKLEVFYGLIRLLRAVCEMEKLSWLIIGGDFNFNTSKYADRLAEYGVTIPPHDSFVPGIDNFVFSVHSDKLPMTVDITVSSVAPRELENEGGKRKLLDHLPVTGNLKVVCTEKKPSIKQDKDTVTEDTSDKTTSEKERPGLTPEPEGRTSTRGPRNSGVQKKLEFKGNEENVTRDEKKRHSSGKGEVKENEIIEDYVKKLGKYIKPVPRDGHCMVNAFSLGLKEKDGQGDYSKKSLLTKIEKELSDNRHHYSDFDDIKKEDLNAYIKDKKYNLSLVDLIPHVVANITNTSILILEVRNGQVHTTPIHPKPEEGSPEKNGKTGEKPEKEERTIYVYKTGDHYDAILDREEAASGLKVEASTSCSSQSPSAISDGYVTREDFERLFSLVERSFKLIDAKIDSLTAEVEKIKLAPPKEQSSDRESTSEKKKEETGK